MAGLIGKEKAILILAALGLVFAAVFGADVDQQLSSTGFAVPGSESERAATILEDEFNAGDSNLVLLVTDPDGNVGSAAVTAVGTELTRRLADMPETEDVFSWWTTQAPQLRSNDGSQALIVARLIGDDQAFFDTALSIKEAFSGKVKLPGGSTLAVQVGGAAAVNLDLVEEGKRDLIRAELLAIPITTILMIFFFRSLIAALLPLAVAAISVLGTTAVLKFMSGFTVVSTFGLNITTALGLGMAVDFSLFTISRYREERDRIAAEQAAAHLALTPQRARAITTHAVQATMATAGRSVVFSALTSAAALAGLLVFDYPLLRSLAYAGFSVILLAMVGATIVLPALLLVVGDNLDRWGFRAPKQRPIEQGRWFKLATVVNRHPILIGLSVTVLLVAVALPFGRVAIGIPDDRNLPASTESRQVSDAVRSDFGANEYGAITVVAPVTESPTGLSFLAERLSSIGDVSRVDSSDGTWVDGQLVAPASQRSLDRFTNETGRWWSVVPSVEPISGAAEELVAEIRAITTVIEVLVGGDSAQLVDNKAEVSQKLPWMLLWMAVAICALLWWSFRSLLMPIKAIALNLLSLTATFGALVWIFQDGNFSGLLGFTPTGLIDLQSPVILFCIAFGLSMDYEVFLLSRIREEWIASGDNARSVAVGLQRTGGIITAAALLMAVVFGSFATGNVVSVQVVGVGLAIAVLVDAFIVRGLLVPAFMSMAGDWNWRSSFDPTVTPLVPAAQQTEAGRAGYAGSAIASGAAPQSNEQTIIDLRSVGPVDLLGGIDYSAIPQPLLVTGATGFIGSTVVDRALANGVSVVAFVLLGEQVPERWHDQGVAVRYGDVRDHASVAAAVTEARSIIHLAAHVSDWGPRRLFEEITIGGTENVLSSAAREDKRVVLASSIAVYGHRLDNERCYETTPMGEPTGKYSWSKQQQEFIARHHMQHSGLRCTIVRPGNVYGPGSQRWVDEIVKALGRGPVIVGSGDTSSGLTNVENVVDVLLACAANPATTGQIFNATETQPVRWRDYCADLAMLAATPKPAAVPAIVAGAAAVVLEFVCRLFRVQRRPQLTREAVRFVTAELDTPNDKALELLGRDVRVDYPTGMRTLQKHLRPAEQRSSRHVLDRSPVPGSAPARASRQKLT